MPVKGGSSGGSVRDIVAGGASFVLRLKDEFTSTLEKIEKRVKAFAKFMGNVGGLALAGGGAILAPLTGLLKGAGERAIDIDKLATKLGVSVEKMSAFAHAAEMAGVDLEGISGDFENLQERIAQASNGTGEAAEVFKKLGLNARALRLKDPIEQMKTIAEAMQKVTNETDRLGMLSALGGDQFQWLNEFFKGGSAGIDEAMAKAPKISTEDAKNAREFARAWTEGSRALQAAILPILQYLTPAAKVMAGFVRENAGLITVAFGAGIALTALGVAITGGGLALGVAGKALGIVTGLISFLLSPVGLLTAGLVALGVVWATQTEEGKQFTADLAEGFVNFKDTAVEAWGAITAALKRGDLEAAGKVAIASLELAWATAMKFLTEKWVAFKRVVITGWMDLRDLTSKSMAGWVGLYKWATEGKEAAQKWVQDMDATFNQMRAEEDKARNENWNKEVADAAERLRRAKEAFKDAVEKAKGEPERWGGGGDWGPPADLARRIEATRGGFFSIGGAQQSLAVGDKVAVQQLDQLKDIAKNAKELPNIYRALDNIYEIWVIK